MRIEADEKAMHCIARMMQEMALDSSVKCLYCKFAFECAKEFGETGDIYFRKLMDELQEKTSVNLCPNPGTQQQELLRGSWIESRPELLKKFTNMSVEEQLDTLTNQDILSYSDS